MHHTKARSVMKSCGPSSRLAINVCTPCVFLAYSLKGLVAGSRYIYDLYYEKEAISKQLYDWLFKNGYADASLIAKWKKQGYEKVWNIHGATATPPTDRHHHIAVLFAMRTNEGDQLQRDVHMSSAQSATKRGSDD